LLVKTPTRAVLWFLLVKTLTRAVLWLLVGENTNKGGTVILVGENTNKGGAAPMQAMRPKCATQLRWVRFRTMTPKKNYIK
jgi:hypothetical protein